MYDPYETNHELLERKCQGTASEFAAIDVLKGLVRASSIDSSIASTLLNLSEWFISFRSLKIYLQKDTIVPLYSQWSTKSP